MTFAEAVTYCDTPGSTLAKVDTDANFQAAATFGCEATQTYTMWPRALT